MIEDPLESVCAVLMAFHSIAEDATSKTHANLLFAAGLSGLCKVAKKSPKDLIKLLDKIQDSFYKDTMQ